MRAKYTPSYLGLVSGYLKTKGWEDSNEPVLLNAQQAESLGFSILLQFPDDILLMIFQYLPLEDLISCEQLCTRLRYLMVHYGVYKSRLDSICKRKKINNYMQLSERAKERKTRPEISSYYKVRLYHYTNKFRVKVVDEDEDEYIQTYKVGRKKAELDRLVQRSLKRFSLSGV